MVHFGYRFQNADTPVTQFDIRNDGFPAGITENSIEGSANRGRGRTSTPWLDTTEGDEITARITYESGSSEVLQDSAATYLGVWLI